MLKTAPVLKTLALTALLVVVTATTGCGNRLPANAPADEEPAQEEPAPAPVTEPVVAPTPAPVVPAPSIGSLVVSGIEKSKSGFISKKMTVKGVVINTSDAPLGGVLKVKFLEKKGIFNKTLVTAEELPVVIPQIPAGGTYPFSVTSTKGGVDEAEAAVETAAPVAAAGYGYGAAASATLPGYGYGAPTGATGYAY